VKMTAEQIIKFFKMQPLRQEGGYYVETYRSAERIKKEALPGRFAGDRNIGSIILYLLTAKTISLLHRLKSDEIFHFYFGQPVTMLHLHPDGKSEIITLGHNILKEQKVQVVVPAGVWQGAFVQPGGKFALLGCSVAPGFEEEDFELGNRNDLLNKYPDLREMILKLTRGQ
jgi:predicted cupin superfamily sugar epimerase